MQFSKSELNEIFAKFAIHGHCLSINPYGSGHIHDTYRVCVNNPRGRREYILQHINTDVFTEPLKVMDNIAAVCSHLHAYYHGVGIDHPERHAITVVKARDGKDYHVDGNGLYWRCYVFIKRARSVDVSENTEQVYQAGRAYGEFQRQLSSLHTDALHDTIPDFHHTPKRVDALETAIASDSAGRAGECAEDIEKALSRKHIAGRLIDELEAGRLPLRITHNDTKINNVLLDEDSGEAVCVIDLDTVMPGLVHYDFGDQIRSSTGHFDEDEKDLDRVKIDLDYFDALVRGYMETASGFLTPLEVDYLVFSGQLITYEIGIRFLTDHLNGDTYFKVEHPGHNLDRFRAQFRFLESQEENEDAMNAILRRYC